MTAGAPAAPGGWQARVPRPPRYPALAADASADVVIVGGGYSGLWTAFHLLEQEPALRVTLLEQEVIGFGASGRNGGWLQAVAPGDLAVWERRHGLDAVRGAQALLIEATSEIAGVLASEQIDAQLRFGGALRIARGQAELARMRTSRDRARHWGWPASGLTDLSAAEASERIGAAGVLGALLQEPCATIDPARLVHGLAAAVAARGAALHEATTVERIEPGGIGRAARVHVRGGGTVTAPRVVLATEAFTAQLPGLARRYLPLTSTIIETEPLAEDVAAAIGWSGGEAVGDAHHLFFYAQRTLDGRIVLGGRGAPYRLGQPVRTIAVADPGTAQRLQLTLTDVWPQLRGTAIEHTWSGALGVPRDWCASCGVDPATGIGWLGGYAGHGVAATYVLARSLAPLLRGQPDPAGPQPWTAGRSRNWEPEPLRWLAAQTIVRTLAHADRREAAGRRAPLGALAKPFMPAS